MTVEGPPRLAHIAAWAMIERARPLIRERPERCLELLDNAEPLAAQARDLTQLATINQMRGTISARTGNHQQAMAELHTAQRHWVAADRPLEAAEAALRRTAVLVALGDYADALGEARRILAGLDNGLGDADSERQLARIHALAHRQLGDALAGTGDRVTALRHYDISDNLYLATGGRIARAAIALERGVTLLHLGLNRRGLEELLRAHKSYDELGQRRRAAYCLALIAAALAQSGQVGRALDLLSRARPELEGNPTDEAMMALVRARVLLDTGLPDEAYREARLAEESFVALGINERAGRAALICAVASGDNGRLSAAAADLDVAERIFTACGSGSMLAAVHLTRAQLQIGDRSAVKAARRKLREAVDRSGNPLFAALGHLVLAEAAADPRQAARHLDAAGSTAATLGSLELRLSLGLGRARQHRRAGRVAEAVDELRRACDVAETIAGATFCDAASGWIRSPRLKVVDELVAGLLELGTHAADIEAWQRATRAKARLLSALAAPSRRRLPARPGDDLALDEVLTAGGWTGAGTGGAPSGLPQVPEGPVLEYFVTGDDLVAFVIREGQVHVRRLPDSAVVTRDLLAAWRQECELVRAAGNAAVADRSPVLDDLYRCLVAPVADLVADLEGEPLLVVGHRHLNAVPFEALPGPDGRPWGDHVDLAFTLGLAADGPQHRVPAAPIAKGLVLAVPDDDAPAIALEATTVAAALPAVEMRLGAEATAEALRHLAPGKDVVHLACHGRFHPENPLDSALMLGDGWLTARQLLDLDLTDALVVLSACTSGTTAEAGAEPIGAAWACLAAGARGVVGALWSVDDGVALELMRSFYAELGAGHPPRQALRLARQETARRHPHPSQWAPFRYLSAPDLALHE